MTKQDDQELEIKIKSITEDHSCYVCYDEMRSQRRKCSGLQRDLVALIHSERERAVREMMKHLKQHRLG